MPTILLTNDDGISAEGLRCLEESLRGLAELVVVAPDRERSAVSHGLTLRSPLELGKVDSSHFTLTGTPADCVIYAMKHLLASNPDLVISGINHGANLADDIMYSGTVAAAREASHQGVPALAVSQAYDDKPIAFGDGVRFIRSMVKTLLARGLGPGICLNVNIPVGRIRGAKITRQGCVQHYPHFNWMGRDAEGGESSQGSEELRKSELTLDFHAIMDRWVSITPLQRDQTDYAAAQFLREEMPGLLQGRLLPRLGLIR